jgi:hypothetical protein
LFFSVLQLRLGRTQNAEEGIAAMGPASMAQALTAPAIRWIFNPITGTQGRISIVPIAGPTGTAVIAGPITTIATTGHGIITTGPKSTISIFFQDPGCLRRCRPISGPITEQCARGSLPRPSEKV